MTKKIAGWASGLALAALLLSPALSERSVAEATWFEYVISTVYIGCDWHTCCEHPENPMQYGCCDETGPWCPPPGTP